MRKLFVLLVVLVASLTLTHITAEGQSDHSWINGGWTGESERGNLTLEAKIQIVNENELKGSVDIYHTRSGGESRESITSGKITTQDGSYLIEFTISYEGSTRDFKLMREDGHLVGVVTRPDGSMYSMILTKK
ncbi:MAG: hypothetical protein V3U06_11780 [Candidatus Binatia bacterium]